jgi:hypothetical protein
MSRVNCMGDAGWSGSGVRNDGSDGADGVV